jgi:hypothetical protein
LIDISKRIIRYILIKHYGEETTIGAAGGGQVGNKEGKLSYK